MKTIIFFFMILSNCFTLSAQQETLIGKRVWMTKNLDVDKFKNGDRIPEAKSKEEWLNASNQGKPAWCYYSNKPDKINGRLYNYFAVTDPRGLAPEGWKIPNTNDVKDLYDSNYYWKLQSENWSKQPCNICNTTKFSALPSGFRSVNDFVSKGEFCFFWTNTEMDSNFAAGFWIGAKEKSVSKAFKGAGLSVRCIKDELIESEISASKNKEDLMIGDFYEGGILFHKWKDNKGVIHGLIIDINEISDVPLIPYSYSDSLKKYLKKPIISAYGNINTKELHKFDYSFLGASYISKNIRSGGKTDWYLPSIDELLILARNLIIVNDKLRLIKGAKIVNGNYWSSNLLDNSNALNFSYSDEDIRVNTSSSSPSNNARVRAIRKF